MLNQFLLHWRGYSLAFLFLVCLSSCFNSRKAQKELLYLQGRLDTVPNLSVPVKEVTIQKGDLLSIVIYSDNPEATAIFNQQQASVSLSGAEMPSGGVNPAKGGYLVNQKGNIYIQSLGPIHVEGLTRQQLSSALVRQLIDSNLLKNPYVDVRFLNFKFTVIGEVNKPGTYTVPDEKVSVLEMLGLAGDLTVYGRRDNILVIREKDGKREFGRIDLRRSDVFQSPYFYLQQNDVVMVEASNKKPTGSEQATLRNLSIITGFASLVSAAAIIVNIFRN